MLKFRITFIDNEKGNKELEEAKENIKEKFDIINISSVYKGRNNSKYSNIYIDVENRKNDK